MSEAPGFGLCIMSDGLLVAATAALKHCPPLNLPLPVRWGG
jgi:hypothetical protein